MKQHVASKHIHHGKNRRRDSLNAAMSGYSVFLSRALELGRLLFTTFDMRTMGMGCVLLLLVAWRLLWALLRHLRKLSSSSSVFAGHDLRVQLYCGGVWAWAGAHATSGFGDSGIRLEAHVHALACVVGSLLLLRCLRLHWTRYMASLLALLAAGAVGSYRTALLHGRAGAALYAASVLLWAWGMQRYALRAHGRLCAGSSATFVVSAGLAAWHFFCAEERGGGAGAGAMWAARGSLLLSALALLFVLQHLPGSPPQASGLLDARLLHASIHACSLLSMVSGPLLLPLLTCFVLHVRAHTPDPDLFPASAAAAAAAAVPGAAFKPGAGLVRSFHALLAAGAVHAAALARTAYLAGGHRLRCVTTPPPLVLCPADTFSASRTKL